MSVDEISLEAFLMVKVFRSVGRLAPWSVLEAVLISASFVKDQS